MFGLVFKILHPFLKLYWFVFRPQTFGVKCAVFNDGKILLVQHTYGSDMWMFPGGGMKKSEIAEVAAKRELHEELGMQVSRIEKIRDCKSEKQYKKDTFTLFKVTATSQNLVLDKWEIKNAQWFTLDNLPEVSEWTKLALSLIVDK